MDDVIGEAVIGEDEEEGEERMISVIAFLSRGVSTSEMFPFGLTYKTVGTPVTGFSDPIGVFWYTSDSILIMFAVRPLVLQSSSQIGL
jgi:hypothetical protein